MARDRKMSYNMGLDNIQQIFTLALTLVFVFAVFFSEITPTYKIIISALIFGILLLSTLAGQVLKRQEQQKTVMT